MKLGIGQSRKNESTKLYSDSDEASEKGVRDMKTRESNTVPRAHENTPVIKNARFVHLTSVRL